MPAGWTISSTLTLVGVPSYTFEQLGFSGLHIHVQSLAQDTASWTQDVVDWTAAPVFPIDSFITIFKDGAKVFYGVIKQIPREGGDDYERHTYQAVGPWYWLEHLVFQQQQMWKFTNGGGVAALHVEDNTHLLLNLNGNLSKQTTKPQMTAVLNYAISKAAPLVIGTITPDVDIPVQEVRDWTCTQVIRQQLKFNPDAVSWFDYSTSTPTFNIGRRSTLTEKRINPNAGLNSATGGGLAKFRLTPRRDLLIPSVALYYERSDTVTNGTGAGKTYNYRVSDKAGGDGTELGAMVVTLELKGGKQTNVVATLQIEEIDENDLEWWQDKQPELADPSYNWASPAVDNGAKAWPDGTPIDAIPLNQIVKGQWQSWMGFNAARINVTAAGHYEFRDTNGVVIHSMLSKPLRAKVIACDYDGPLGEVAFSRISTLDPAEPVPTGLAAYLLSTVNVLQYEGSIEFQEEECNPDYLTWLGCRINFDGAGSEFANMNAVPQSVEIDVDTGRTIMTIGPAHQLGAQDLMEWLRGIRLHRPAINFTAMSEGLADEGADVEFSQWQGQEDTTAHEGQPQTREYRSGPDPDPANPTVPYVRHDAKPIAGAPAAQVYIYYPNTSDGPKGLQLSTKDCIDTENVPHVLKVRQMAVCEKGVTKYVLGVFSEVYTLVTPPT